MKKFLSLLTVLLIGFTVTACAQKPADTTTTGGTEMMEDGKMMDGGDTMEADKMMDSSKGMTK
ncbi:MAG: hypothetical protein Q8P95_01870 [bacterium]|nr:hypothetical protein [bacterium]